MEVKKPMDDFLFSIPTSIEDRIQAYEDNGRYFLTLQESAKVLGLSVYEVRYAILNYRLDALLVTGEYRILTDWIRTYGKCRSDDYTSYARALEEMEFSGVHALAFEGRITEAVRRVEELDKPYQVLSDLVRFDRQRHYDDMPSEEEAVLDWYGLSSLTFWPADIACIGDWASLLRVNALVLAREMSIDPSSQVEWPEMYDFLVEREVLNLPCPFTVWQNRREDEPSGQLTLF